MELTKEQKKKAKRELLRLSDDAERADILMHEMEEIQEESEKISKKIIEAVADGASKKEILQLTTALSEEMRKVRSAYAQYTKELSNELSTVFKDMQKEFTKGLKDMQTALVSQSEGQAFDKNAAPLYKTMINHLSGMEKSFANWKYPQYASVSVRNKNFANINPSISPFGIEDYDEIDLTYSGSNITTVVYKLNGTTMGTLTLSYSGSNITKVVRT